jgi:hypothetical protein
MALAARHEAAGADHVAALPPHRDHPVENAGVEVVIGRIHHDERRGACGKSRHDRAMRATPGILHELDRKALMRVGIAAHRRQRIVVGTVVADQHARRCLHLARKGAQHADDIGAFVVDRNDDVEFSAHRAARR